MNPRGCPALVAPFFGETGRGFSSRGVSRTSLEDIIGAKTSASPHAQYMVLRPSRLYALVYLAISLRIVVPHRLLDAVPNSFWGLAARLKPCPSTIFLRMRHTWRVRPLGCIPISSVAAGACASSFVGGHGRGRLAFWNALRPHVALISQTREERV